MNRRRVLSTFALGSIALLSSLPRLAVAETKPAINVVEGKDIAIQGLDPVAYFTLGEPRPGRAEHAVVHSGARWLFSSADNKQRFEADPVRYIPAYGGHCAFGTAQGYLVDIDPRAFTIVNDRLYLNYDLNVRETWLANTSEYNRRADQNWLRLGTRSDAQAPGTSGSAKPIEAAIRP